MSDYKSLLAAKSQKVQAHDDAEDVRTILARLREEMNMSQTSLAAAMGITQPAVNRMEQPDNDPRLSTLQRYVKALGGELSIEVKLPDGKTIIYAL